jgi:predicted anti-sigma-YlaC factor YlaD
MTILRLATGVILTLVFALQGCAIRQYAINTIGDSIASGSSVYESDDDIELVGDALPFGLKTLDSLIAKSPKHRGLLLAASRGYLLYAYAYVDYEADRIVESDFERGKQGHARAHRLYLRAFDYAMRGLEAGYPGIREEMVVNPAKALQRVGRENMATDVALLYSAAATLGLAIASDKQDPAMLARLPEVDALIARALELDEAWNDGALHELAMMWLSARPGVPDTVAIERHYARALELSGGKRASVYVTYAEAVMVREQKRSEFVQLMNQALAVPLDADPRHKLLNALAHRRARWQLTRLDQLFLE